MVYIREAHPSDGWQVGSNQRQGVVFKQPKTLDARGDIAKKMCSKLEISLPCLLDGIDNKVGKAYAAWPDRLYVVGIDGKISFKGGRGPFGFKPKQAAEALAKQVKKINQSKGE